jgi:hypothetical protein
MSADAASILFLNPALCEAVKAPQPGDLGLIEQLPGLLEKDIYHIFTFLGPNRRFEKASPYGSDPFKFVETSSQSASRFVRCQPMQKWVDDSLSKVSGNFFQLSQKIAEIESLIDSRNTGKSLDTYAAISEKMKSLSKKFGNPTSLIQDELGRQLSLKGISSTPKPSEIDNQFYKFSVEHPELVGDQLIFAYLWLSARMETVTYIFQNYKFLQSAGLLP